MDLGIGAKFILSGDDALGWVVKNSKSLATALSWPNRRACGPRDDVAGWVIIAGVGALDRTKGWPYRRSRSATRKRNVDTCCHFQHSSSPNWSWDKNKDMRKSKRITSLVAESGRFCLIFADQFPERSITRRLTWTRASNTRFNGMQLQRSRQWSSSKWKLQRSNLRTLYIWRHRTL